MCKPRNQMIPLSFPARMASGFLFRAAISSALLAAGPQATAIKSPAGPAYTETQISEMLNGTRTATGLFLADNLQGFANIANDLNSQNPNLRQSNHSGFSIMVYAPAAWLGAKRAVAVKEFRTFGPEDANSDDRLPVLRVIVHPDSPEYLTALGAANANNAEHVVLRSIDKTLVAQPLLVAPTTQEFWNGFGARASFAGLVAVFSMADLEKIRGNAAGREFLITIVGESKRSNRDFRIKQKHFDKLGDVKISPAVQSPKPLVELGTAATCCSSPTAPVVTGPILNVGGGVTAPKVVYKVDAEYSEKASAAKYSGTVSLELIVGADGNPYGVHVVKPLGLGLDEKAIEAVEQWRFLPGMEGGKPVNVRAHLDISFRLP